jgi:hypothetical protein
VQFAPRDEDIFALPLISTYIEVSVITLESQSSPLGANFLQLLQSEFAPGREVYTLEVNLAPRE